MRLLWPSDFSQLMMKVIHEFALGENGILTVWAGSDLTPLELTLRSLGHLTGQDVRQGLAGLVDSVSMLGELHKVIDKVTLTHVGWSWLSWLFLEIW